MSRPALSVSHPVIREVVARAATEVPGVLRIGRGGSAWRRALAPRPVRVRLRGGAVEARVVIVARPGHALPGLAAEVRSAVAAAIERLLALRVGTITVLIDGVGA